MIKLNQDQEAKEATGNHVHRVEVKEEEKTLRI
jgi:hypothetical protein